MDTKIKVSIGPVQKYGSPGIIDDFDCTISSTINYALTWERIGVCIRKISLSSLENLEKDDFSKTFILTDFKEDKQYRTKMCSKVITNATENELLEKVAEKVNKWREEKIAMYRNNNWHILLET